MNNNTHSPESLIHLVEEIFGPESATLAWVKERLNNGCDPRTIATLLHGAMQTTSPKGDGAGVSDA